MKVAFWFHDFLKIFLLFKNYWFLKYVYIIRSPNKRTTPPQSPPTPHKIGKKWFIFWKKGISFPNCARKNVPCFLISWVHILIMISASYRNKLLHNNIKYSWVHTWFQIDNSKLVTNCTYPKSDFRVHTQNKA